MNQSETGSQSAYRNLFGWHSSEIQYSLLEIKRKSAIKYGSILDPGPYQKPLSITLAPINSGKYLNTVFTLSALLSFRGWCIWLIYQFILEYQQQPSASYRPENEQLIQGHTASDAIKRVYHLEDGGFIPIVTNHGSAIDSSPVQRGITFTKLSQGEFNNFNHLKQLILMVQCILLHISNTFIEYL